MAFTSKSGLGVMVWFTWLLLYAFGLYMGMYVCMGCMPMYGFVVCLGVYMPCGTGLYTSRFVVYLGAGVGMPRTVTIE